MEFSEQYEYNNPFLERDLSDEEVAQLKDLVNHSGWKIFEEIRTFNQGHAIASGLNISNDRDLRDAACGTFAAVNADLNFKEDVMQLRSLS